MSVSQSPLSSTHPGQVWPQLTADRRRQAIRCLAQLALNVVTAKAQCVLPEVSHEQHPEFTTQTTRRSPHAPGVYLRPPVNADAGAR